MVVHTLGEEFNIYREVGGDSLPLHSRDSCNGLQPNGKEGKHVASSHFSGLHGVIPRIHSVLQSHSLPVNPYYLNLIVVLPAFCQ